MLTIGLTGGIGAGKSLVSDLFAEKQIDIIDADVIARDIVAPHSPCLMEISNHFGDDILQSDGSLDRAQLRHIIFSDDDAKQWLESLLHPAIREQIRHQLATSQSAYCILSAPLLFENKLEQLVDRTLVVDLPESLQRERAAQRDNTNKPDIERIMTSQITRTERLAKADDVIDNGHSVEHTRQQVEQWHQLYLKMAQNDER